MILEYYRTRPDALPPTRANPSDAGLDVHFNPDDGELKGVYLEPGESKLFSTGLKFGVPHGYMLEVKKISEKNKSNSFKLSKNENDRKKFWAGRKAAFPACGVLAPDYLCMDGSM